MKVLIDNRVSKLNILRTKNNSPYYKNPSMQKYTGVFNISTLILKKVPLN